MDWIKVVISEMLKGNFSILNPDCRHIIINYDGKEWKEG